MGNTAPQELPATRKPLPVQRAEKGAWCGQVLTGYGTTKDKDHSKVWGLQDTRGGGDALSEQVWKEGRGWAGGD